MRKTLSLPHTLSVSHLKWIALFSMLLDHIAYFFSYLDWIPGIFHTIGRIAAPLYMFCLAEGFAHTRSRKRYFLRIYLLAMLMSVILFLMQFVKIGIRADGFYPENCILTLFSVLLIVWQGMDWLREKRLLAGLLAIGLPLCWPMILMSLIAVFPRANLFLSLLSYTLIPTWGLYGDTSIPVLAIGLLMYPLRERRNLQVSAFSLVTFLYHFVLVFLLVSGTPGFAPASTHICAARAVRRTSAFPAARFCWISASIPFSLRIMRFP